MVDLLSKHAKKCDVDLLSKHKKEEEAANAKTTPKQEAGDATVTPTTGTTDVLILLLSIKESETATQLYKQLCRSYITFSVM